MTEAFMAFLQVQAMLGATIIVQRGMYIIRGRASYLGSKRHLKLPFIGSRVQQGMKQRQLYT